MQADSADDHGPPRFTVLDPIPGVNSQAESVVFRMKELVGPVPFGGPVPVGVPTVKDTRESCHPEGPAPSPEQ